MNEMFAREAHPGALPKAYNDPDFVHGHDGRAVRMLAEYLAPEARLRQAGVHDTIVFFGSARTLSRDAAEAALRAAEDGGGDLEGARRDVQMSRYYEASRELAGRLSEWSAALPGQEGRFVVCTGGGPGIMEAANRGASEAGASSVGLRISIPNEQFSNPYVSDQLGINFHYFFMRKFWFTYPARAVVVMPGGFGTLDELFEVLVLIQTLKMKRRLPVVLFGGAFWERVVNLQALVEFGMIDAVDLGLLHRTDCVDDAFAYLTTELLAHGMADIGPSL